MRTRRISCRTISWMVLTIVLTVLSSSRGTAKLDGGGKTFALRHAMCQGPNLDDLVQRIVGNAFQADRVAQLDLRAAPGQKSAAQSPALDAGESCLRSCTGSGGGSKGGFFQQSDRSG